MSIVDVVQQLKDVAEVKAWWGKLEEAVFAICTNLHAESYTTSFEVCPKRHKEGIIRLHMHLVVNLHFSKVFTSDAPFEVLGMLPAHEILQVTGICCCSIV